MKKNSIWAKQLTPVQLERFKESFANDKSNKMSVVEYFESNTSKSFRDFIELGSFIWMDSNEGYDYWNDIANEKPVPEEIDENFKGLDSNVSLRDYFAAEAVNGFMGRSFPLENLELMEQWVESAYTLADLMLEARKPKAETKGLSKYDAVIDEIQKVLGDKLESFEYAPLSDSWLFSYGSGMPESVKSCDLDKFLKRIK